MVRESTIVLRIIIFSPQEKINLNCELRFVNCELKKIRIEKEVGEYKLLITILRLGVYGKRKSFNNYRKSDDKYYW